MPKVQLSLQWNSLKLSRQWNSLKLSLISFRGIGEECPKSTEYCFLETGQPDSINDEKWEELCKVIIDKWRFFKIIYTSKFIHLEWHYSFIVLPNNYSKDAGCQTCRGICEERHQCLNMKSRWGKKWKRVIWILNIKWKFRCQRWCIYADKVLFALEGMN